jgi:hypothetical protein
MEAIPRRAETRPSSKIASYSLFGAKDWGQLGFWKGSCSCRGKDAFPVDPFFVNCVIFLKYWGKTIALVSTRYIWKFINFLLFFMIA